MRISLIGSVTLIITFLIFDPGNQTLAQTNQATDFPWLVAILEKGTDQFICAGTVIDREWILTSSSPLLDYWDADEIKIVGGTPNYFDVANAQVVNADEYRMQENPGEKFNAGNSLMIKLASPLEYDLSVYPLNMFDVSFNQFRIITEYKYDGNTAFENSIKPYFDALDLSQEYAFGWDANGNQSKIKVQQEDVSGDWIRQWSESDQINWMADHDIHESINNDISASGFQGRPEAFYRPLESAFDFFDIGFTGGPLITQYTDDNMPFLLGVGTWWMLSTRDDGTFDLEMQGNPDAIHATHRWYDLTSTIYPFVLGVIGNDSSWEKVYQGVGARPQTVVVPPETNYVDVGDFKSDVKANELIIYEAPGTTDAVEINYEADSIFFKPGFYFSSESEGNVQRSLSAQTKTAMFYVFLGLTCTYIIHEIVGLDLEEELFYTLMETFVYGLPMIPFIYNFFHEDGNPDNQEGDDNDGDDGDDGGDSGDGGDGGDDDDGGDGGDGDDGKDDAEDGSDDADDDSDQSDTDSTPDDPVVFTVYGDHNQPVIQLTRSQINRFQIRKDHFGGLNTWHIGCGTNSLKTLESIKDKISVKSSRRKLYKVLKKFSPDEYSLDELWVNNYIDWVLYQKRNGGTLAVPDHLADLIRPIDHCQLRRIFEYVYHADHFVLRTGNTQTIQNKLIEALRMLKSMINESETYQELRQVAGEEYAELLQFLAYYGIEEPDADATQLEAEEQFQNARAAIHRHPHIYNRDIRQTRPLYARTIEYLIDWNRIRIARGPITIVQGIEPYLLELIRFATDINYDVPLDEPNRMNDIRTIVRDARDPQNRLINPDLPAGLRIEYYGWKPIKPGDTPYSTVCIPTVDDEEVKEDCDDHEDAPIGATENEDMNHALTLDFRTLVGPAGGIFDRGTYDVPDEVIETLVLHYNMHQDMQRLVLEAFRTLVGDNIHRRFLAAVYFMRNQDADDRLLIPLFFVDPNLHINAQLIMSPGYENYNRQVILIMMIRWIWENYIPQHQAYHASRSQTGGTTALDDLYPIFTFTGDMAGLYYQTRQLDIRAIVRILAEFDLDRLYARYIYYGTGGIECILGNDLYNTLWWLIVGPPGTCIQIDYSGGWMGYTGGHQAVMQIIIAHFTVWADLGLTGPPPGDYTYLREEFYNWHPTLPNTPFRLIGTNTPAWIAEIVADLQALCDPVISEPTTHENSDDEKSDLRTKEKVESNILDVDKLSPFLVFPNPNEGNFILDGLDPDISEYKIRILDLSGKTYGSFSLGHLFSEEDQVQMNLNELKNGMYLIIISENGQIKESLKFKIER